MRFKNSLILAYTSFAAYTAATSTVVATVSDMAGTSTIGTNGAMATGSGGSTGSGLGSGTKSDEGSGAGVGTALGTGVNMDSSTEVGTGSGAGGVDDIGTPHNWVSDGKGWAQGRWGEGWRGMHPHMPRGWVDWFGGNAAPKDKHAGQPHRRYENAWQSWPADDYEESAPGEGQGQVEEYRAHSHHSHHQRGEGDRAGYGVPAEGGRSMRQDQTYRGQPHHRRSEGGSSYDGYKIGNANYRQTQGQVHVPQQPNMRRELFNSGPSWNNMISGMTSQRKRRSIPYESEGWSSGQGTGRDTHYGAGNDADTGSWKDHSSHEQKRDESAKGKTFSGPAWFQHGKLS